MSRTFSALLWKERMEAWRMGIIVPVFFAIRLWGQTLAGLHPGESSPVFDGAGYGLTMIAFFLGAGQILREREGDKWSFAIHRPASSAQIFGAKLMVGSSMIIGPMLLASFIRMAWPSMTGGPVMLSGQSIWKTGVGDCFAYITYYAAGLFYGSHRGPMITRLVGFGVALVGLFVLELLQYSPVALAVSATLASALVAAAWLEFFRPSDFTTAGAR